MARIRERGRIRCKVTEEFPWLFTGGRVAKGGSTLASFMAKQIAVRNKDDHIDPREAILRHAKECEENPFWIAPAYAKNQPKPIFRDVDPDEPPEKMTKSDTFG